MSTAPFVNFRLIDRDSCLVPTSLAASILLESPKRGMGAAGTSENEVRFGISLCAATPPTSAGRRAPDTPAADDNPRTLVHKVRTHRSRDKNPAGSKTAFSGPAKNASPPRAAGKFHLLHALIFD